MKRISRRWFYFVKYRVLRRPRPPYVWLQISSELLRDPAFDLEGYVVVPSIHCKKCGQHESNVRIDTEGAKR